MSRRLFNKQVLVKFLLVLLSTCIALFIIEIAARFLPPPYNMDEENINPFYNEMKTLVCNNTLGWTGKPNYQGILEGSVFRQELKFNSLGMYDTEHLPEKAPNTFRILMLGDSMTQAVQVNEAETAHQVLEDNLNKQSNANSVYFEVLSGAVANWGTNQQLIYYREQGRSFQPDLVLLMFYFGNDLQDNLPGNVLTIEGFNCYTPYFAVCNGNLDATPLTYAPGINDRQNNCSPVWRLLVNTIGRLYQNSRLYQQLEPLIIRNRPRQLFGRDYPNPFMALYLPNDEVELEQAWPVSQATIVQLQQEVEANGAQFAVALVSPELVVELMLYSPAVQENFVENNPQFAGVQVDRPNQRLAKFLNQQNIPFIDLTIPMVEYQVANGTPLYLIGDGHWTVEGNRVSADILAHWLNQNGFLPQ